jgi:hypothetical protein
LCVWLFLVARSDFLHWQGVIDMKTAHELVREMVKRLEKQNKTEVGKFWLKKIKADLDAGSHQDSGKARADSH